MSPCTQARKAQGDLGDTFNAADAERLQNSLSKDDSENLERITTRMIEMQEAAAGTAIQLVINTPLRGRLLEFQRPLQVKPNSPMQVSFTAARMMEKQTKHNWLYIGGLFAFLFASVSVGACAGRRCCVRRPAEPPAPPEQDEMPADPAANGDGTA